MSQTVYNYRVYCTTEAGYVYKWDTVEPTTCPNNNGHSINSSLTTIVETISTSTIKAEENSDGYFETGHIVMNIPSGTPGATTEHDVTWPMDVMLWRTLVTPTSDMIGDIISVVAAPETTIGVVTSTVNIGETVLIVNSTVLTNIQRGFRVNLWDGVNKNVLGRCTAKDVNAGTITVETGTTNTFASESAVQIGVFTLKDINITDTATIDIGTKGFKGKTITSGTKMRVHYTNNSGTSKILKWRYEVYALG